MHYNASNKSKSGFWNKTTQRIKMEFIETYYYDDHYSTDYTFEYKSVTFRMYSIHNQEAAMLHIYHDKKTKEQMMEILEILDIVGIDYSFDYIGKQKYIKYNRELQSLKKDFFEFKLDYEHVINIFRNKIVAA